MFADLVFHLVYFIKIMTKKFDKVILTGYRVTFNPAELDAENGITPEIRKHLDRTLKRLSKGVKHLDRELEQLISKYPGIPQFKNYLTAFYSKNKQQKKAIELNNIILKEHPDYLFGKINLALQYLREKNIDKIPELLGRDMEIKSLYPERDIFHIEEILSFYQIAVFYFIETGDIESAEMRLKIMSDLDVDHIKAKKAAESIFLHKLEEDYENSKMFEAPSRTPKFIPKTNYKQTKSEPEFVNPEIKLLYQYGFQIDHNIIKKILGLPRESLIEDLKKVVIDSISRYKYFKKETVWEFHTHSFVFHALFLLSELKAYDALEVVLDLLRQDRELLDYWLSDSLTEDIWKIIFNLGQNQLNVLKDFMLEEGNYTYSRTAISQAVVQVALHFPERRQEVIQWYNFIFNYFIENKENNGLIDTSLIGLMIGDILELNAFELEKTILKLYHEDLVDIPAVGTLDEVFDDLFSEGSPEEISELPGLEEIYRNFAKWERDIEKRSKKDFQEEKHSTNFPELPEIYRKTGRNEKCPCGSGLKFKKCHGKS